MQPNTLRTSSTRSSVPSAEVRRRVERPAPGRVPGQSDRSNSCALPLAQPEPSIPSGPALVRNTSAATAESSKGHDSTLVPASHAPVLPSLTSCS